MSADGLFPQFDTEEFHRRWLGARLSAFPGASPDESESALLEGMSHSDPQASEKDKDMLLRNVFDNSRKLALSLSRHLGVTFEPADFQTLLSSSRIPCVQGTWTTRHHARVLARNGCGFCPSAGALACDYWREALDGLVMGLGEKERVARHASARHGDDACVDVFFSEAEIGRGESPAWGPLPEHMALDLWEMAAYFQRIHGIPIEMKGFREGVLYYAFGSSTDPLCGTVGLLTQKYHAMVREKFPGLVLKDVTPQAVLGTGAE